MVDAQDPECAGPPLVVDPNRRHGPASNNFARRQRLLRSFELLFGESVDDLEDLFGQVEAAAGLRSTR